MDAAQNFFNMYILPIGWKILGAIVLWFLGGWVIGLVTKILGKMLKARKLDSTLANYLETAANVLLRVLLVIAVLGTLGVETTSFAALLAAVGLAIGTAWGGLLAHFAAGVFMIFLRPFKVGDYVIVGGVEGTVKEIGLFNTSVDSAENVRYIVGNNKIFSDNIVNFSTNPHRRIEIPIQIDHTVNPVDAIEKLKARLAQISNVVTDPAVDVDIKAFNLNGTLLSARLFTHTDNYGQVYFDATAAVAEVLLIAKYPIPQQHYSVHQTALSD